MTVSRRTRREMLTSAAMIGMAGAFPSLALRAQEASPAASPEEDAVGEVLFTMAMAFATHDAEMAASVYTEDAEWINAFGDQATGRAEIRAKLEEVFSSEEFDAGEIVGEPQGSVRILTDDTAAGWTYEEIEGQVDRGGNLIPLRKNHCLAVLVKQDGRWLIAAHMFMDENIIARPHRSTRMSWSIGPDQSWASRASRYASSVSRLNATTRIVPISG